MKRALFSVLFFLFMISAGQLSAERSVFHYNGPLKDFVPRLIDAMSESGIQFTVKGVYNEEKDKKQGFVFYLKPSNHYCEITFAQTKGHSIVKLFTQEASDMSLLSNMLIKKLKMKEVGVTDESKYPKQDPNPWPVQGLK